MSNFSPEFQKILNNQGPEPRNGVANKKMCNQVTELFISTHILLELVPCFFNLFFFALSLMKDVNIDTANTIGYVLEVKLTLIEATKKIHVGRVSFYTLVLIGSQNVRTTF